MNIYSEPKCVWIHWKLIFPLRLQNNVCSWHASADRCCSVAPFSAIICSEINSHNWGYYTTLLISEHTHSSTKDKCVCLCACVGGRVCVLQTHNHFLWLQRPDDDVFAAVLSGHSRPLTAGSGSERCDSAGKLQENKSVSDSASLSGAFLLFFFISRSKNTPGN